MVTVPHEHPLARRSGQLVASGALDLVLAALLYAVWLAVDEFVVLVVAMSTLVAALVSLAVGVPRLRRERAARRTPARGPSRPAHVGPGR
jgi:Flp pilus assembly protein TadB